MEAITIISIVFGSAGVIGGLTTVLNIRSIRKLKGAEASKAHSEAKQVDVNLQQDQYDFLLQKLNQYQAEWASMQDRLNEKTAEYSKQIVDMRITFTSQISEKCNEIAKLKSSISFYRGFRCYKSDCAQRNQKYNRDEE